MRPTSVSLLAASLLLLPLGLAAAQDPGPATDEVANPTRTVTFYPHVFAATGGQPMPGNTQFPWGEDDFSAGYPGNGCYPQALAPLEAIPTIPPPGSPVGPPPFTSAVSFPTCENWNNNRLYVYSTAGFVHADEDDWSYEDFHNERGQAKDILLDTTQDITATMYMSADWHPWQCAYSGPRISLPNPYPCWNWDPGFFPEWQIEATLMLANMGEYQGQPSEAPPVHEKVLSGDFVVVGQGLSDTVDMLSLDSSLNQGQGEVYEFTVNLGKAQVDRIPKEVDWVMMFRWWMKQGEDKVLLGQRFNWNINSGEFYPIRFTMPVKNPFDVELVYPQFLHDKLLLHAILNSPWGSYDVDSHTVRIDVVRDGNQPVTMERVNRIADFSVAHGGHYKPVNVTWVWDYKADGARPGVYKASVTAFNFQHSAQGTTEAEFRINPDGTGTVLKIGRSGQQTATQSQLEGLQGQPSGQSLAYAAVEPPAPWLALGLAGLSLVLIARRNLR